MGDQTTTTEQTTETEVEPKGEQENKAIKLLMQMAEQASQQMGQDFQLDHATAGDKKVVSESIGASADMARREMEKSIEAIMAQLDENLSARNMQGSTVEAMKKGQIGSQGLQELANMMNQSRQEGANTLLNLPMQRQGMEGQLNQQLYARLVGGAGAVMQSGLSERLNSATVNSSGTQTTPFNPAQLLQLGGAVGAL